MIRYWLPALFGSPLRVLVTVGAVLCCIVLVSLLIPEKGLEPDPVPGSLSATVRADDERPGSVTPLPSTQSDPYVVTKVKAVLADEDEVLLHPGHEGREGRLLSVLVPYDRTRFFIVKGEPRGFEFELVRQFEVAFNKSKAARSAPLQTLFVPVPFGQALDLLEAGKGDIAAGGFTVTPERASRLPFSDPYMENVRELVVHHATESVLLQRVEDLAGQQVVVVSNSSYAEHLRSLNDEFEARKLAPIDVVEAPVSLMSEDILELVHSGAVALTVVDEHIARLWSEVLSGIRVTELAIAQGNSIAWALSPNLGAPMTNAINGFMAEARRGSLLGNILFHRYFEDTEWISNPLSKEAITEISRYRPLFSRYADEVGLDWRLIAAVAFQESGFDPYARSAAGAVGLMQVLPTTAAGLGIKDLNRPDAQIAAGTRYLASMIRRFEDEGVPPDQALNLALASYNTGPRRLAELRAFTERVMGLDPDIWFLNVERAAARKVGQEPVRYVANVHKYRLAYELGETVLRAREAERAQAAFPDETRPVETGR
jgi:membrane-bound lytic murein transglycosylase MltF